jgi:pilus assembly protein CpaB
MKNRTVIGIICMVLAVIITFAIAPVVNRLTSDTTTVIRLSDDVKQGAQITEDKIETTEVKTDSIPAGVIAEKGEVIGKYAVSNLYAGDYFTSDKLTAEANTADDVFASLDGTKVAVSITIDSFAAGLSGKLKNGDVISVIVTDKDTGNTSIPGALKYVKVITTTTAGGVDKDSVVQNDDGTYELPSTVTVLVSTEQAKLLAKYEDNSTMQTALVYRGNIETANKFLATQDEYLKNGGTANE